MEWKSPPPHKTWMHHYLVTIFCLKYTIPVKLGTLKLGISMMEELMGGGGLIKYYCLVMGWDNDILE